MILARIVHAQCYDGAHDVVDAGGYGASRDAIWALHERGWIKDITGVGRGIRDTWATDTWKHAYGVINSDRSQETIDNICHMISQHLWPKEGKVKIRARTHSASIWKEAVQYLSDCDVMRITSRFTDVATPRDLYLLRQRGVVEGDHYEFEAIDAEFVESRRFLPDWEKHSPA